jgi:hypothetical protein
VLRSPNYVAPASPSPPPLQAVASDSLSAALGGAANIESIALGGGRVLLQLRDAGAVSVQALQALGVRAIATLDAGRVHLLHAQADTLLARS